MKTKHNCFKGETSTGARFRRWACVMGLCLMLSAAAVSAHAAHRQTQAEDEKQSNDDPIVETVQVENILLPVRVFDGKKPVAHLEKSQFKLTINGKEVPIHGFFREVNRLELAGAPAAEKGTAAEPQPFPSASVKEKPRLFVLVFNLSDANQDLGQALDIFFDGVVRPGDRIMSIINRSFLAEWTVTDAGAAKRKVLDVVNHEISKVRPQMAWYLNELKSISAVAKSRFDDETEQADSDYPSHIFKDYFLNYRFILEDIKSQYLSLPVNQYIKIANYLKNQRVQKYVFSFYQLGRLPLIDPEGEMGVMLSNLMARTDKVAGSGGVGGTGFYWHPKAQAVEIRNQFYKFVAQLREYNEPLNKDIGRAFIDSGATFHTMLLKPANGSFSQDYRYEDHTTDTEVILKQLARETGGSLLFTNDMNAFIKKVTQVEDVVYMLSYVPADVPAGKRKSQLLSVSLKGTDKSYRIVFDNRDRDYSFQNAQRQINRRNPDLVIDQISCRGDMLTVKLKNIKLVPSDGKEFGAVRARIKIVNQDSKIMQDFEKAYKGLDETGVFKVTLPELTQGRYNVLLEVKDLFALTPTAVSETVCVIE